MCGYVTHGYSATISSNADVPISGIGLSPAIGQGASVNVVKKGTPVIVDFGGGYNGYITDETRVYAVGELKDIFLKGYQVAREIVEETMSFAKRALTRQRYSQRPWTGRKRQGWSNISWAMVKARSSFVGHGLRLEIE